MQDELGLTFLYRAETEKIGNALSSKNTDIDEADIYFLENHDQYSCAYVLLKFLYKHYLGNVEGGRFNIKINGKTLKYDRIPLSLPVPSEQNQKQILWDYDSLSSLMYAVKKTARAHLKSIDEKGSLEYIKKVLYPASADKLIGQLRHDDFGRQKILDYAYALGMDTKETREFLDAAGQNPLFNLWDPDELLMYYAIALKGGLSPSKLEYLKNAEGGKEEAPLASSFARDTEKENKGAMFNTAYIKSDVDDIIELGDKDASLKKMKELLSSVRKRAKKDSETARKLLNDLFEYILDNIDRIRDKNKWVMRHGGDKERMRNDLLNHFWYYSNNQMQVREEYVFAKNSVKRQLPTKAHIDAVYNKKEMVTKEDLEFAFFLKFALDNPLDLKDHRKDEIKEKAQERYQKYRTDLETDILVNNGYLGINDKSPFDRLLLVCIMNDKPVSMMFNITNKCFFKGSSLNKLSTMEKEDFLI